MPGLKLPEEVEAVSLDQEFGGTFTYPPLGFYPFEEHQLGNGDTFGLYWPIGREDRKPIVAEVWHDSWSLVPQFSSLAAFLRSVDTDDEGESPETPQLSEDNHSPRALLIAARQSLKQNVVEDAVRHLEQAIDVLPEYGEALSLLALQYRRLNRQEEAIRIGIRAVISSPSFGGATAQSANWLARQQADFPSIANDPVWIRRQRLTFNFGGQKTNDEFILLRECIDTYVQQGRGIEAAMLAQSYGELMSRETVSFQERYSFVVTDHIAWQIELSRSLLGCSRTFESGA